MNNIVELFFQYGFHDTELFSIDFSNSEIRLSFDNGIYLLDKKGKETILSKPIQIILEIDSDIGFLENVIEIREYGKKLKYIDYSTFKKCLKKQSFGISKAYYSNFDNCLLFDGGFLKKNIMLSIENIKHVVIQELKKDKS